MQCAAVEIDALGAVGHVPDGVAVQVQLFAVLVEVGDLQVLAVDHGAAVGRALAEQDLQQRGLAAAVGADDAQHLAALQLEGKVAQHGGVRDARVDLQRLEHALAGLFAKLRPDLRPLLVFAPVGGLFAQIIQRPHAAHVARAAGLHALAQPGLFLGQFFVEVLVGGALGFQCLSLAPPVVGIATRPVVQRAAVDFHDAGGDAVQKRPVVADEHQRQGCAEQEFLQPGDACKIEVVGGFVQQQQVGLADQRAGQQHAPLHAPGQPGEFAPGRQAHAREQGIHFHPRRPGAGRFEGVLQ